MDRRAFLAMLGLSGAGLALGQTLPAAAEPPVPAPAPKRAKASRLVTPTWFMVELASAFREELGAYRTRYRNRYPPMGVRRRLCRQHYVQVDPRAWSGGDPDFVREAYVRPAAHELARRVKREGLRHFYKLQQPVAPWRCSVVTSATDGFCLRGTELYNVAMDKNVLHIDLIGARA